MSLVDFPLVRVSSAVILSLGSLSCNHTKSELNQVESQQDDDTRKSNGSEDDFDRRYAEVEKELKSICSDRPASEHRALISWSLSDPPIAHIPGYDMPLPIDFNCLDEKKREYLLKDLSNEVFNIKDISIEFQDNYIVNGFIYKARESSLGCDFKYDGIAVGIGCGLEGWDTIFFIKSYEKIER